MINKIIIWLTIICAFPILGNAQINLVHNGSFEDTRKCPTDRGQIMYANHWHSLDSVWAYDTSSYSALVPSDIPALFTTCGDSLYGSIPANFNFYYHNAHTGNSMVQILTYNKDTALLGQRQHAQSRLRKKLLAGQQYCVSFYISLNQVTAFAHNNLGAFFDDGTIDTVQWPRQSTTTSTPVTPQVFDTSIYTDTLNWHKIQGSFVATGNEQFITIANFFDKSHTSTIPMNIPCPMYPAGGGDGYSGVYLIDDVSVIAVDAVANAGRDTSIGTEMSDSAWIGNHDGYVPCRWYNMSGTIIDSNMGGFMVKPGVTTSYIMELDVCGHVTRDTVVVYVGPSSVGSRQSAIGSLRLYPNPASDEITIEGANDCEVVIYDVVGRQVMRSEERERTAAGEKAVINVSQLQRGLYTLQAQNKNSGERKTLKFIVE